MKKEIVVKTLPFVFMMVGVCIPLWDIVKFLEYKKVFDPAIETGKGKISFYIIFLSAVLIAPFIEELIFRYPLQKVKNKQYRIILYIVSSLLFGFIHIINYDLNESHLKYLFIITSPQIFTGFVLGFIRLKYGFWYSVLNHSLYNFIILGWDNYFGENKCFLCDF